MNLLNPLFVLLHRSEDDVKDDAATWFENEKLRLLGQGSRAIVVYGEDFNRYFYGELIRKLGVPAVVPMHARWVIRPDDGDGVVTPHGVLIKGFREERGVFVVGEPWDGVLRELSLPSLQMAMSLIWFDFRLSPFIAWIGKRWDED